MSLRAKLPSNWITRLFERVGVDLHALKGQFPREFELVVTNPADVPLDNGLRLLGCCEQVTGDRNIGLRLAEQTDFHDMGVYGYLLLNAQTLGQLLQLAARYFGVLIRTSKIYFDQGETGSRFRYRIISPITEPERHDVDWSFGAYVYFTRQVLGDSWRPRRSGVTYPAPPEPSEIVEFYGPHLEFEAEHNYFELDSDLLDYRINDADPRLLDLVREHADLLISQVQESPDFLHQVRLLAIQSVSERGCNAQKLASEIGMSVSTFNRRLAKQGTNFRQIRDETIRTLARQALQQEDLRIGAIAARLGYAETAAFNHAFKRLEGISPREYRRRVT